MSNCRKYFSLSLGLALILVLLSGGCALLGSGNVTVPRAQGYHVKAPRQWRSMDQPESDQAYRLPSGAIAALNSSCNGHSRAPLEQLTRDLLLGDRNVQYLDRKRLPVDGVEGMYSSVTATMSDVPFHFRLFVLAKAGCVFDFSLISPRPIPEPETEQFLTFVNSFKYGTH